MRELQQRAEGVAAQLEALGRGEAAGRLRELGRSLVDPAFRIVVFGEFNQGKSTLINALLGTDALPMSVLPTTALLTEIRYGEAPGAVVRLGGVRRQLASLEELEDFITLDLDRQARGDVDAVSLTYPADLCRAEVILYDTPGLNDRAEQDAAATEALDLADLVLFVMDIRRLGTLNERTVLEQWLTARGLDAVIVAANFVNLVPPQEYGDLRERLGAFAKRWGCPYLPENCFEVDALGGLRAQLMEDERAWERSGMGRLAATLGRSSTENRQLLHRRSRLGRLLAFLREELAALGAAKDAQAGTQAAAARRAEGIRRGLARARQQVAATGQETRAAFARLRTDILVEVAVLLPLPRQKMPDVAETCRQRVAEFLARAQREWQGTVARAVGELPPGPSLEVKTRCDWPFRLPNPVFEAEPEGGPVSVPRDREEAIAAGKEIAERGRRAAEKAAAGLHRGIGSLLDRAASSPDPDSTPGRLIGQARGAWSNLKVPETGESESSPLRSERLTPESRATIERYVSAELEEVDQYLERLESKVGQALARRADRALAAAGDLEGQSAAWQRAETAARELLEALERRRG